MKEEGDRRSTSGETWCALVKEFGRLFYVVAGKPHVIDSCTSRTGSHRYRAKAKARELLAA